MIYVCLWNPVWSIDAEYGNAGNAEGQRDAENAEGERDAGGRDAEGVTTAAVAPLLAELAPRLRVERGVVWADGRGLDAVALAERLLARLEAEGLEARAGISAVPVAAELAARWGRPAGRSRGPTPFLVKERTGWGWRRGGGSEGGTAPHTHREDSTASPPRASSSPPPPRVIRIEIGREREWLAGLPLSALRPDARLETLLTGVGVETVGGLAELPREAVEVRFGAEAVGLWRLARADDRRRLFRPVPPERPHGSIDFVDYVLTDPARLLFTANALLTPLCDRLSGRGEHARTLRIWLPLADGGEWQRTIRPARPTASRDTWLRLVRRVLERLTVPDAVVGMRLEVGATEPAAVQQGDLFDRGFASAAAVEAAVARLAEQQTVPMAPEPSSHPLLERRTRWKTATLEGESRRVPTADPADGATVPADGSTRGLTLQLLPAPRRIRVDAEPRRDHQAPVRLGDRGGSRQVLLAAGPDRVSGGQWEPSPYAREYFRCVTEEGALLWIYRDALSGGWYLHGYWD